MAKHETSLNLLFSALGDPTRRAILSALAGGPRSVSQLAAPHDMALPTFMGHLKKLEEAGLVQTEKLGRTRTCSLCPDALQPVRSWLEEQRDLWEGRLDRFDDYVTKLAEERNDA